MPEPQDDRTPDESENQMRAFLDLEAHKRPRSEKQMHVDDEVTDYPDEPDWHKQGRDAPPGWKRVGDTFVEE